MNAVQYFFNELPPCNKKEILRYSGCGNSKDQQNISDLVDECIKEAEQVLKCSLCYIRLPLSINGSLCSIGDISVESADLAKHLDGCDSVVVFAATVGIGLDRLIAKHGKLSPSKGLILQAIGAERIESLCDAFCQSLEDEYKTLTQRFSPGYGDLSLEAQRDIFNVLGCHKIGITLNDSLIISPSKSVTAIIGIGGKCRTNQNKCDKCNNLNCEYRGRK